MADDKRQPSVRQPPREKHEKAVTNRNHEGAGPTSVSRICFRRHVAHLLAHGRMPSCLPLQTPPSLSSYPEVTEATSSAACRSQVPTKRGTFPSIIDTLEQKILHTRRNIIFK
ncbi:hypothetical protein ACLOJK_025888 [Asimina triloba]